MMHFSYQRMASNCIRLAVLVLSLLTFTAALAQDDVAGLIESGLHNIDLQRIDEAHSDFNQAVAIEPENIDALLGLARTSNRDEALKLYDQILELDAENLEAMARQALLYALNDDYDLAFSEIDRILAINPEYALAFIMRARVYDRQHETELAIADANRGVELGPDDWLAYYIRGSIIRWQDQKEEAVADFTRALELNQDAITTYVERGNAYAALQDYQAAIDDFTQAIEVTPGYLMAYYYRGITYNKVNQSEDAIADMTVYTDAVSGNWVAWRERGIAFAALGRYQEAVEDYTLALELGEHQDVTTNRAEAYLALGDYDRAIADYQHLLELEPDSFTANYGLAKVYFATGDYENALVQYDLLDEMRPTSYEAELGHGRVYLALGNYPAAIDALAVTAEIHDAAYIETYRVRSQAYTLNGQPELGLADCLEAVRLTASSFADTDLIFPAEGGSVDASIAAGEQALLLTFQASAGMTLTLGTQTDDAAPVDTIMAVLRPDASPIACNDDISAEDRDSQIVGLTLPQAGIYSIMVGAVNPGMTVDFTLNIDTDAEPASSTPVALEPADTADSPLTILDAQLIDVPVVGGLIMTLPDDWLVFRYADYPDANAAFSAYQEMFDSIGGTVSFNASQINALQFQAIAPNRVNDTTMLMTVAALPISDTAASFGVSPENYDSEMLLQALGLNKLFDISLADRNVAVGANPQVPTQLGATFDFPDQGLTGFVMQLAPAELRQANLEFLTLLMTSLRPTDEPLAVEDFVAFTGKALPSGITMPVTGSISATDSTEPTVTVDEPATQTESCVVSAGQNANLRAGPGTNFNLQGTLAANSSATALGQTTGADGMVWYQLDSGAWVRFDIVSAPEQCETLPHFAP